jgi:hypothetical protein
MAEATDIAIGIGGDGESKNSNDFNPRQLMWRRRARFLNRVIMFTSIVVIVLAGAFQIKQSSDARK